MAAKLKVFQTSDGITDYVVAVSSRPKALAAFGVHQDLFKQGLAFEVADAALIEAATARPGEVLERPAKSKKPPSAPSKAGGADAARRSKARARARAEARDLRDKIEDKKRDYDDAQRSLLSQRDEIERKLQSLDDEYGHAMADLTKALKAAQRQAKGG